MKKNIKIFVSRRIDQDSKIIDNPLFVNVRCGACFDPHTDSLYIGDNTGENISNKRKSFCELTVHYWAWKNQIADYYGLCHYRRFLSFSNQIYKENDFGVVEHSIIDNEFVSRFGLFEQQMRDEIEKYDVITNTLIPVSQTGNYISVYDYCKQNPSSYYEKDIDTLFKVIKDLYPEDYSLAKQFFAEDKNCWYNCYVMRADIFNAYSQWLFDILFEFERRIDTTNYTQEQLRMCGVLGERLWGIYLKKLELQGVNIGYKQLAYVKNTNFRVEEKIQTSDAYIPIVIPVDENSVALAAASIQSIVNNSENISELCFIILAKGKVNQKEILLNDLRKHHNLIVQWKDSTYYVERYKNRCSIIDDTTANMFSVFDICSELEKIILVLPGIIFLNDIQELYSYNIGKAWIGAAIDVAVLAYAYNKLNVHIGYDENYLCAQLGLEPYTYYNTDLLILRIKEIKAIFSTSALVDNFFLHDYQQPFSDCINEVFKAHFYDIPQAWNAYYDRDDYIVDWAKWFVPSRIYEAFEAALYEAKAVNYRKALPISAAAFTGKMYNLWKNVKETSFYEALLYQMQYALEQTRIQHASRIKIYIDKLLPIGTRRRNFVRKIIPRDSVQWKVLKKIYLFLFNH